MTEDISDYQKWKRIVLDCDTEKEINIVSYGDWELNLYGIEKEKLDESGNYLSSILRDQEVKGNEEWYKNPWNEPFSGSQYIGDFDNPIDAFKKVNVEININKEQFIQLFGFWKVEDFTIYEKDGNRSIFSFQTQNKGYIGKYYTS